MSTNVLHSKKVQHTFNVIKHALNVRYKTDVKRMNRAPYL